MTAIGKECPQLSQEHRDALKLVQHLFDLGGGTSDPNNELASKLYRLRRGAPDMGRFYRARNHARDRVDKAAAPCCGYRLHYRQGGGVSSLELIDPSGPMVNRAEAAIQTMRGWAMRELQHQTENARQQVSFNAMGDECVAMGDKYGAKLNYEAAVEIENFGTVTPKTLAAYNAWLGTLSP